jgi:hypothetical protein
MKKILFLTGSGVLVFLMLTGCGQQKFNPGDYLSYQIGNNYTYTGPMTVSVDTAIATSEGVEYVMFDFDQDGKPLSKEVYLKKEGKAFWKGFDGGGMNIPIFKFEPPILASPFSNKVGEKYSAEGTEIRQDGSRLRFQLNAEVMAVEEVKVPAGTFKDCLKIKSAYQYLDTTSSPLISGEASRWYAKGVGIVKIQMTNSANQVNVSELLAAKVGDKVFPVVK